ncbi:MAG: type II toxin-antitoxin system VapC family toxin [Deltaproteobacteria bacterium]|nr:type II toxin-antitoxin system VapC family toxin [Deltaproteobacteria bacterium]
MILDTDVLVDFLRGQGAAERVAVELKKRRAFTTAITAFELWAGAKTSEQAAAVETLLGALPILPLETPGARRSGEIQRALEQKGTTIGMADSLIAGICLEQGKPLLTRNKKHFQRVPDLQLIDL